MLASKPRPNAAGEAIRRLVGKAVAGSSIEFNDGLTRVELELGARAAGGRVVSEFVTPSWTDPLDVAAAIRAAPEDATVKGMFFHAPLHQAERAAGNPITEKRYVGFKDYAVREHMQVLADCARVAFPSATTREGLRRLGHGAYGAFVASMVGKVVMSAAAREWASAVKLVGRAYSVVGNRSSAVVEAIEENEARIKVTGVWNFPDTYHVGVLEAAMRDYEIPGTVSIRAHGLESYTYRLAW